jgi:hypothetical protein
LGFLGRGIIKEEVSGQDSEDQAGRKESKADKMGQVTRLKLMRNMTRKVNEGLKRKSERQAGAGAGQ